VTNGTPALRLAFKYSLHRRPGYKPIHQVLHRSSPFTTLRPIRPDFAKPGFSNRDLSWLLDAPSLH
jgi:hypothetical protein